MGRCRSCQKTQFRLKEFTCIVCGKNGCNHCLIPLMNMFGANARHSTKNFSSFDLAPDDSKLFVCSNNCMEKFIEIVRQEVKKTPINLIKNNRDPLKYVDSAIVHNNFFINQKLLNSVKIFSSNRGVSGTRSNYINVNQNFYSKITQATKIKYIDLLKQAGRFEEAALVYESLGRYSDAGAMRAEEKKIVIKNTQVKVDLNSLLQQIQNGGLVVMYRCPHCNAPLKIDEKTKIRSLKICEHCETPFEAIDIAGILNRALS